MNAKPALITFIGLIVCTMVCAQTPPPAEPVTTTAPAPAPTPTPTPAPEPVPTPAAPAAGSEIPLISFQDVALTTAIENLARQAGLNYILDPKVPYGQPAAPGQPATAQPNISIRWEHVTAEQALSALLNVYSLQLVDDPKTKVSRITTKDPAAAEPLLTKVIQLKYASPSNVLANVQSVLTDEKRRSKAMADTRTSQLVIVATEKEIAAVEALVVLLDVTTKQVLIEAKILETTVNPKTVKGIDWGNTLGSQNITFGNGRITDSKTTTTTPGTPVTTTTTFPGGRTVSTTTTPTSSSQSVLNTVMGQGGVNFNTASGFNPQTAFLNADGLSVALSFLNTSADTKTISEPRMVTLDNQKASIDVGLMYPIVNTQAGTAQTAGGSSISYSNLTVNLEVTPRITANDFVELKVQQSILRLGPKFASKVGGVQNEVDSFFTRKMETGVMIPSGSTLVMGGLISDESLSANTKVPLLGDLPGIGGAFRKDSKERNRQNLIIFLTPTIVTDSDFRPSQSRFLHSTNAGGIGEEWSAWDSGRPYDWSNPHKVHNEEAQFDDAAVAPKTSAPKTSKP